MGGNEEKGGRKEKPGVILMAARLATEGDILDGVNAEGRLDDTKLEGSPEGRLVAVSPARFILAGFKPDRVE